MQKKLAKILVLSQLLVDEIDHPTAQPNKKSKEIQDKARELQELLIPVVDRFYATDKMKKDVMFNTLQDKFNYIFEKEYK